MSISRACEAKCLAQLLSLCALFCTLSIAVSAQKTPPTIQKTGKYQVEVRLPARGIFAEEETDIEFRISDTSQNDPIQGAAPVINATVAANLMMPVMPSMPMQRPTIHREGVPGDYGVVVSFPHGGDYRLTLNITPPADKPFTVSFPLTVGDAKSGKLRPIKPRPYTLEVRTEPAEPRAGQAVALKIVVRNRESQKPVTEFDVMHERLIHFVIVSDSLSFFRHEHPERGADAFTLTFTFPAAGTYALFADTAPKNAGQQILRQTIRVSGAKTLPAEKLLLTAPRTDVDGFTVSLKEGGNTLPVGRSVPLQFSIRDKQSGKSPAIQPWLGAPAHLILIHQDTETFVHSHPEETAQPSADISFQARLPKPGLYKAWLQFQVDGVVHTASFVVQAKEGAK